MQAAQRAREMAQARAELVELERRRADADAATMTALEERLAIERSSCKLAEQSAAEARHQVESETMARQVLQRLTQIA